MATSGQQEEIVDSLPTPQVVGNAFVQQYYSILHQSPKHVVGFYQETSKLSRPDENGAMSTVSTLDAINEKILFLHHGEFGAEITNIDVQDSHNGAVIVLVTGYLFMKERVKCKFTQTFFLAPQENGYFVLNDIFRFVDGANYDETDNFSHLVEARLTPEEDLIDVPENLASPSKDFFGEKQIVEVANEEAVASEEEPVAEVVDEIQDDSHLMTESNSKIEDAPKKSYASIVMKVRNAATVPTVRRPVHKPKEKVTAPPTILPPKPTVVLSKPIENGSILEVEASGYSIYIKGLPMDATPHILEAEFKKFGAIKNNGVQVRSNMGFCFGFVEYELQSSVRSAIEGSPVTIDGCQAFVEEKRSTNTRDNRSRFSNGRSAGGFRNEGARGRGNYGGGRGYMRGDFSNRNGGRGHQYRGGGDGYQYRGDRYQNRDHTGSNGARLNQATDSVDHQTS